ncbi:MAG TPA: PSD1 and planctomycete cytochrome C domain-containing protein [Gemmataceae bacterium]|nr:PSD1 and planctomycete cytochrome C domain-containing protein [Gemmataceae bacterium]
MPTARRPIVISIVAILAMADGAVAAESPVDFNRDIRPILSKNCFACHGPDDGHRMRNLRLDRRDDALKERRKGSPIVPGKPDASLLIQRVSAADDDVRMPPAEVGSRLAAEQIETLKRWIAEGANYAEHWAFVRSRPVPPPTVGNSIWEKNGIDPFVLERLSRAGLTPNPPADRYALIRRLSLDLRGLPPTPQEVDGFVADKSPDAYERLVERFLADPAYGERWARVCLDLARYADSAGYGSDPLRPDIYPYRDWVIAAINRNLPYDQFTIDQLAGDLLPGATTEQRLATAFHRNTMTNTEGGTDDEEFRVAAIKDRVDTTGQVWMGLTIGCAKCHSHKFDPISHEEYYRVFAIFNQSADSDKDDERPTMPVPTPAQAAATRRIDGEVARLRGRLKNWTPTRVASLVGDWRLGVPAESLAIDARLGRLEKSRPKVTKVPVMVELPAKERRETRLMRKGNYRDLADKVEPGVPAAFLSPLSALGRGVGGEGYILRKPDSPSPQPSPQRGEGDRWDRLALARWILDPANPLTARVAVNRLWAQLFGVGLVETEEDFGTQGEPPSHPELLDWLAIEYVRRGWDTKAMLRLIVTSATYRQSSRITPERLAKDPRNRLLSRGPRLRLEAEAVRDQALALSGLLSRKLGGPSVFPMQPDGLWQAAFNGQRTYPTSKGPDRYRRGLYTFWRRTVPYPSMAAFDAPSRETCTVRRIRTNTPLQALVTLNDPVYLEAAQALARRIVQEGGETVEERAAFGLRLCLSRPPRTEQVRELAGLFGEELHHYKEDAAAARKLAGEAKPGKDDAELAAWTVVANVLLNLDGVLTKG